MRIVALIIVVAIVCLAYGWTGAKHSPQERAAEAQSEADPVTPSMQASTPASSTPASGSLRAPMDRTRQVLESVKDRNVE